LAGGYNGGGDVSFASTTTNFDLQSGYFAAAWSGHVALLVVEGWDDGMLVARATLILGTDRTFVRFGRDFDSVDEVHIKPAATSVGDDRYFAMDDLLLEFTVGDDGDGDGAAGADARALVASAAGGGSGGPVLGGALTLDGADPSEGSYDWLA
jgi:hypothetical protein